MLKNQLGIRSPREMDDAEARRSGKDDGTAIRGDYRAEPCGILRGMDFSPSTKARAMDSTGAPVSTAVELETLVISAFRNFSGSRRYGLVSMSGFCSMGKL